MTFALNQEANYQPFLQEIIEKFKTNTRLPSIEYELKGRADGDYLIIYLSHTTDRFFKLLQKSLSSLSNENPFKEKTTIKKRLSKPSNYLKLPETQFLRTILSESLTASQHSFSDDFFSRYIKSVTGDEEQIISQSNHIVYGRRGSGKSSLLAYLMHNLRQSSSPFAWVNIQTYSGRSDTGAIAEIFIDILEQLTSYYPELEKFLPDFELITSQNESLESLEYLIPKIRRSLGKLASQLGHIFIFLDDIHILKTELQPILLDKLYSLCRGNQVFLKISGIEQFVKLRDPILRQGLETPGDIQIIRLDYNLTTPDQSKKHIEEILNKHAIYCGLPSIDYICGQGVIDRLVWVSAGVPRDALYLFSQAIRESSIKNQKKVSVTGINLSASKMADEKLKDIQLDTSGESVEINKNLNKIRDFCIKQARQNCFLVEIQNENPVFHSIETLISLRLLHILYSSFTPSEVGKRYMALMLDYGLYVAMRPAKSIDLFTKEPRPLLAKEVRQFPTFKLLD